MFPIDPVTVLVSIVVILFLANAYNKQKQQKGKNLPPGPRPLPIIGSIHLMDMSKPHKSFIELSKKYGPIYTIQLGTSKMVVLCGYDIIKEALINMADEFADRPIIPIFYKGQKDHGVVFSNGESWKAMRRFTLSALRDYGMGKKAIEDKIIEEAECLVQTFRSYGGKPFNDHIILNAAVANIIASMLMDKRFDYDDPTLLKLMARVNENITLMGKPMARLYNMFPTLVDPLPGVHHTIANNTKTLQSFMKETFTKQRKDLDVNDQRNVIDAYLVKQQEGKPESTLYYHDDNLTALISQLFGAGMETTSTTLRWAILIMIKYPEVQRKVQSEIDSVIGTALPKLEHKKQMPYTDAVLCEIQRFGDIAPDNLPHATTRDVTLRGYFIPKGTTIIPLLSSVMRDEAHFEKPYEFYPEHFLDADGNFKKNEAFIPFSAGRRSCAGETLAKMELFLFYTVLLQNFTFQAPPGAVVDLTPTMSSTNAPSPHEVIAIPRNKRKHCNTADTALKQRRNSGLYSGFVFVFRTPDQIEDMFDPVTILVSIIVILFLANVYNSQRQQKGKNLPPGPRPLPIIGSIHLMDLRKPHKTFIELSKKYGPIYTIQLGTSKMVILCGYDIIKEALINMADEFADRPKTPLFYKIQKDHGIVFSNRESWKAMRRFTLSALRDYGMGKKAIEDKITEEAGCLVQTFRSYRGKPFNNQVILNAAVANIIASMLLNHRFEYDDPILLKLMFLMNENIRLLGEPMAQLYNMFPRLIDPLPGVHNKIAENAEEMHKFMRETFTRQRKDLDVNDQRNIIDAYLVKQQEGKPESTLYYHDDNLTALIAQLFGAGMETTSTTLRWAILIMIKYPEVQKKVQSEIDRVIGTAPPKLEHRKQMPYTEAVVCEVQRFGDIAPTNLPHATAQDVTLRGYFIPKGTTIMPVLSSALRDEAYFAKPYEFYPEHFLDADGNFKKIEAFIPFSQGKRSCAGETLAKMELFLFFTTLLQNFTFQAPPGAEVDLTPTMSSTNAPSPHEVIAMPRN
ncbi:uncharacterized protein [Hyperolius riggenbachi]|uniref:uncharacterized protein n=1 Tax=Hyperolius riggenbachi TaxID=752182 RepID=UPI0035A27685